MKIARFGSSPQRLIAASLATMLLLTSCSGGKQVRFSSLFKEDDELTAEAAFKIVQTTYRIKPDRRYLLALSDISSIVTGKPLEKTEFVFENEKWKVKAGKSEIAEIENFPTFANINSSLLKYARSLEGDGGQNRFTSNEKRVLNHAKVFGDLEAETQIIYDEKMQDSQKVANSKSQGSDETKDENTAVLDPIDNALLSFSPKSIFKAIDLINARWNDEGHTQQTLDQAATALTSLAFQITDKAGTADELYSRALAFAVLSKRYETVNARRNLVRLAESMGYRAEAIKLARELDEEDPLRIYILWQAGTVGAAINQGFDTNEAKFLYAKKLAQQEDLPALKDFSMGADFALPVAGFMQEAFACQQSAKDSEVLASALFTELEGKKTTSQSATDQEQFFPRLNKSLENLSKSQPEAQKKEQLIEGQIAKAFYRAFAYTYLLQDLQPYNGSHTEIESEKIFEEKFGKPAGGQTGNSIYALAHSILDSRAGHYQVAKLLGHAVSAEDLGDYPCFLAYAEAARWFPNGDQKLISAAKTIFANIDSRPESRFLASRIAHNELLHPVLANDLNNLGFDADFSSALSVSAAEQSVDLERLRRIFETKTRTPSHRARAIAALCRLSGRSDTGAKNLYVSLLGQLLENAPQNLEVLRQYAQTAIRAGKAATAINETKSWIDNLKNDAALQASGNQLLATLYYSNGNAQEALGLLDGKTNNEAPQQVAEAYVNSLIQKGNDAKAQAYADAYYTRNRIAPSALALEAQMLWKKKAFTDAALLLKNYPWCIKEEDWRREIYPAFKLSLSGHQEDSASAVRALAREGFSQATDIGELSQSFAFYGRNDLAFKILNSVLSSSFSGHELSFLNLSTMAFSFLQKSENEAIALKWIQERVPPQFFTPLAMFAFQNGAYGLLWKLIPPDPQGVGAEYVWLTRAAAMPMQKGLNKDENRLLIQHYAKNDNDVLFQIGKCLIGAVDSKGLMTKRINVRELCDLSYFLGSREAYLGDQTAAAKWYHMALETGLNKASEMARNAEAIRRLSNFYPDWSDKP